VNLQHNLETMKKQCADLEADEKALDSKVKNRAGRTER
jgi:hypothetical protein